MEQAVKTPARGTEKKKAENELALQEFGHELKRVRRAKRYTQKRLHELTGIDETVISDLENGNYTPSLALIRQLAEGLNISPYTLVAAYYGLPLPDFNPVDRETLDNFIKLAVDYINQGQPQSTTIDTGYQALAEQKLAELVAKKPPTKDKEKSEDKASQHAKEGGTESKEPPENTAGD